MGLHIKPGTDWDSVFAQARALAPEAFESDRLNNLIGGQWQSLGTTCDHPNPVDQSLIPGPPRVDQSMATAAVASAVQQHHAWASVDLDERKSRVAHALVGLREGRDTIALLLAWEIGKPWRLACADVDRCIDGVDWYLTQIDRQLDGRRTLPGPISN
ncbi:MAG: aldehyde dehydrogenase family protein, partial [Actinomycetes bacterium]